MLSLQVKERDEKIAALATSLKTLDEERDELQNQLDSLAEEATLTDDIKDKAHRDCEALKSRLLECESRLSSTVEELTVSRHHCSVAEGRIASLKGELEEANNRYAIF